MANDGRTMRMCWAAVGAAVLLSAGPLPAGDAPMTVINVPVVLHNGAPIAVLAPPQAAPAPPPRSHCANGNCGRDVPPLDLQCVRDWLCYRPLKGGCPKGGSCGCNCSVPLYAYFITECQEGRKYELPPCAAECNKERPSVFRQMWSDGRGLFRSGGGGSACASGNCAGGTGHRLFGLITGH